MANLTSLLYPISAAVTALPPISAAITRAPTIEQKLDSVVSNTNNVNNIYSNSLWLTPGFNMTTTGNSPVANYVNSATFEGSLFKITGYNGSSTDDYLIIFLGAAGDFNSTYFRAQIKAKQSFEFEFPRGIINGQFVICNSTTAVGYNPGESVLTLNITYYPY